MNPDKTSHTNEQSQVVGTWRLISAEDKDPTTGKWYLTRSEILRVVTSFTTPLDMRRCKS